MLSTGPDFERAIGLLRRELSELLAVYLFGSAARGALRRESDIDLAVLCRVKLDPLARWELQERLAVLLGRDIHLVDLRAASTVLRIQVLRDGKVLFDAPGSERALFEATALGRYARLNEERHAILEDIRAQGRVYG